MLFAILYCYKIEPEVVLAASWHHTAEMMSRFDSPTPILFRRSVEVFRLSLTFSKVIRVRVLIWTEIWHPSSKTWGF
jgi:hypothetical protein